MESSPRILLYTGNGKGKTTAALGLCVRAAGNNMRVCFIQFVKNMNSFTGEAVFLDRIPEIDLFRGGLGMVSEDDAVKLKEHAKAAQDTLDYARSCVLSGNYELIVLDEIILAVDMNLLSCQQACELVRCASSDQIIVMTGRNAPRKLIELSDTVTEMCCIRHAFSCGRSAQTGVER